jgi:hypothetical protein
MFMRGKSRLPDPRRERAIMALVHGNSRAGAAEAANISERVLYRWLRDQCFVDQYNAARQQFLREGVAELARLDARAWPRLFARIHGLPADASADASQAA